ncbi:type II toxin-antitoxin system RelE/ParE family toxin [Treponema zuelzerae]|uniref:Type II toxin-antitoxin system RelE/ParE family toxin n=1 Tax=Teretinema zuelzerae TaxID=156 RepID=A0AAE3EEV8_9SPIR|nr:type II toxin-antitoxin system RelE/ParE family toxin [Teretinema zuelzerae]MCD1653184.1 type II toxin-antitoxin system RelE/ParE family toxin [Teretinema zuelzerae]
MPWVVTFHKAAITDVEKLDGSCKIQVLKAIQKVSRNPLPYTEGGYGKPLGNKESSNLAGYMKIKLAKLGLRVVYRLVRTKQEMKIIVISIRADNEVYELAERRIKAE